MGHKRRCSLCGERLDSSLRCTACGLDNTKNDSMYKNLVNQNDCKEQPLTHVHEEPKTNKNYGKVTYTYKNKVETAKPVVRTVRNTTSRKKKPFTLVRLIVILMILFSTIIPALATIFNELSFGIHEEVIPDYPYTPSEAYDYEYWLSPGLHEAGVHIPYGMCEVTVEYGEWVLLGIYELDDTNGSMMEKYSTYLEAGESCGFELEEGDYLVVEMVDDVFDTSVWLYTDSSDFTESVYVEASDIHTVSGEAVVGEDIPAGVYDVMFVPEAEWGYGEVQLWIETETSGYMLWDTALSFEYNQEDFDFSEGNVYGCYTNIPLTPGTTVIVGEELGQVYLAPSYEVGQDMYDITWGANE